jgi:hypothetical protein
MTGKAARSSVVMAACVLWFFAGTMKDGVCRESTIRTQAVIAPTETGLKLAAPDVIRNEFPLALRVAEAIALERQILEGGAETIDSLAGRLTLVQRLDAAQDTAVRAAPPSRRSQSLQQDPDRDRDDAVARMLASTLRAQLDAVQPSADTARIRQAQELAPARGPTDPLARELAALRAELDTARLVGKEAVQAIDLGIRQTQALEQERDKSSNLAHELALVRAELNMALISVSKAVQAPEEEIKQAQAIEHERGRADTLARDLASLQAELDAARNATADAAKTAATGAEQKLALEQELKQQRDAAEALARQLTSLRAELDTNRAAPEATRTADAAKIEQAPLPVKAGELASARKQAEECSIRLAAAYAEVLQATESGGVIAAEQKDALVRESERAASLTQELAALRTELEARDRQFAALNASRASQSSERRVEYADAAASGSQTTEEMDRLPQWASIPAAVFQSGSSSASDFSSSGAQWSARQSAQEKNPNITPLSDRPAPGTSASHSLVDEQRLLARANALLRQADISGARPLLEHALERGSARAAFMLAETYDVRILQSWRARGISGDPARARELYERAQAGGIEDAKERIKALK